MLLSAAVTVILNGSIVASVVPARLAHGRVVAPVAPIVVRLASRVSYDRTSRLIVIERNGVRVVAPVAFVEDNEPYVALAPVVARLGGSASFDTQTKTLAIVLPSAEVIATPAPFAPGDLQASPSSVFTPAPPLSTPRATESGVPRPRRTAIPVVPSEPIVPGLPVPEPTSRRR